MSDQLALFGFDDDEEARRAVRHDLGATLFVEAGAGSGKTTALVERVVALVIDDQVPIREIAAITFTEKAAAELRSRLRQRFAEEASNAEREAASAAEHALVDLDGAAISTLHAFAQRILGEHPVEAGLPPGVEVLDEISSSVAFDQWWADTVDEMLDDPTLERTILLGDAVGITPARLRDVASALHDNWDLVAARLGADPPDPPPVDLDPLVDELAELTDARKGCADPDDRMVRRLDELAALVDAVRSTSDEAERLALLDPRVAPSMRVSTTGRAQNWEDGGVALGELRDRIVAVGARRDEIRQEVVEACLERWATRLGREVITAAEARRRNGRLEFHDLLVLAREMLRHPEHGAEVRASLGARYRRLLLDEFQDTDPIQIELAVLVASDDPEAGRLDWSEVPVAPGRLFFVGDPKQSIYRFRRADIALFLRARSVFGAQPHRLTRNFRSTAPVIEWVNRVFGRLITPVPDSQPEYQALTSTRAAASGPGIVLLGERPHPSSSDAATLRTAEARDVVGAIRAALAEGWAVDDGAGGHRPATLGDITILMPSRTSLTALEERLDQAQIPHRAESSSLVYASAEIRDLVAVLRAIDDITDELALVTALRSPAFGCGDDDLFRYHVEHGGRWNHQGEPPSTLDPADPVVAGLRWLGDRHRERLWLTPSELIDRVVRGRRLLELGFAGGRPRDLWRRLRFVTDQARAYHDAEGGTLRDFLEWADRQAGEAARVVETVLPETDDDAVRIMTIHAAKGLEFPITIVSGMTTRARAAARGSQVVFPPEGGIGIRLDAATATPTYERYQPIDEQMGYHERLRLLYVAATRARDHLVVSVHRAERKQPAADATRLTAAELIAGAAEGTAVRFLDADAVRAAPPAVRPADPIAPTDRERWAAQRAAALAVGSRPRVVAATTFRNLERGTHGQRRQQRADDDRRRARPGGRHAPPQPVDQNHVHADRRQVGVAVSVGLQSDLHDADGRHQHPQEPAPAHRDLRSAREETPREHADGEQHGPPEERRRQQRPHGVRVDDPQVGVEAGEVDRPEGLRQIEAVSVERAEHAYQQREALLAPHPTRLALAGEGDRAGHGGEEEERHLLQQQPPGRQQTVAPALERPAIEEQQEQRERDEHRLGHQPQRGPEQYADVAPAGGPTYVARVGDQRREEEDAGQGVLALGDPGHRLHAQGMPREERGHYEARPEGTGGGAQEDEEQHRSERVQQDAPEVMAARVEAEELDVDHVGDPGERLPVEVADVGEGPREPLAREPPQHVLVLRHVARVVVVDEVPEEGAPVDGEGDADQDQEGQGRARLALAGIRHAGRASASAQPADVDRPLAGRVVQRAEALPLEGARHPGPDEGRRHAGAEAGRGHDRITLDPPRTMGARHAHGLGQELPGHPASAPGARDEEAGHRPRSLVPIRSQRALRRERLEVGARPHAAPGHGLVAREGQHAGRLPAGHQPLEGALVGGALVLLPLAPRTAPGHAPAASARAALAEEALERGPVARPQLAHRERAAPVPRAPRRATRHVGDSSDAARGTGGPCPAHRRDRARPPIARPRPARPKSNATGNVPWTDSLTWS